VISACIVSPAWRRFDVTRLVLEQRSRLRDELASRGIDAGLLLVTSDRNRDIAAEYGCDTVDAPNDPLGRKANVGLAAAVATGADWIVWVGSDDLIHPDAFEPLHLEYELPVIIRGKRIAMVNLTTGVLQQMGSPSAYGAIPWFIDRRLFAVTQIRPIKADLQRGLDGSLFRGLRRHRIPFELVTHDPHAFRCVDFKTPANLSPFDLTAERLAGEQPEQTLDALHGWFHDDLVAKARAISEVYAHAA
jgi:glycosyltransferase involved in cell wall biosynthesis